MTRAKTDVVQLDADVSRDLKILRDALKPVDRSPEDLALCGLETFVCVALLVLKKTNPSKVRGAAITVEIGARLDGKPVLNEQGESV